MAKKSEKEVSVLRVNTTTLELRIVGTTPLICNAMSAKVREDLLFPPKKKNQAEKQTTLKHDPMGEYRRSPYRAKGDDAPTRIVFPGGGFKAAIAQAAVDIPGAAKAQIGRLSFVEEHQIPIYGVPQMFMTVVRQAGMSKTPDVRTRAILPEWAASLSITFVRPNLTEQNIADLVASAGIIVGIGDWRPEKGKGNHGQFRLADTDDAEYERIVKSGGLVAQDAALENPTCFDIETEELWEWFQAEVQRRGFKVS
jgi:hypothetical protein